MSVWLQIWGMILHGLFAQSLPFPGPGAYPSVPPPPLSGMVEWFAADFGNNCGGVACTDGASQDSWADKSGNGNFGGLIWEPIITNNCVASVYHTNQINGKPAVTLNGSNVSGSESCFTFQNVNGGFSAATTTAFMVVRYNTATVGMTHMGGGATALIWGGSGGTFVIQSLAHGSIDSIGAGNLAADQNWHQINYTYNSSTGAYAFRADRSPDGSGTNAKSVGNVAAIGTKSSGGSIESLSGQIAEFILYTRILSGAEITTVETYLNSRYGL